MLYLKPCFAFYFLLLVSQSFGQTVQPVKNAPQANAFDIKRGINISHWLSQSTKRGNEREEFFTKNDVIYIASLGFDHLRLPVDEEQLWREDGAKDEIAFKLLHNAMSWCKENNLKVVIDLHILRSHHFNAEKKLLWTDDAAQQRFFKCWRELSAELKKYPESTLAYELMNEPVADNPEDWNQLLKKAIAIIRLNEPSRKIVVGSNKWQNTSTFDVLKVPENDSNLILSFHMYEPFLLTHHLASWTEIKGYTGPVHYPGQVIQETDIKNLPEDVAKAISIHDFYYNKETIDAHFQKAIAISKKYGLPLYCGEWGCLPTVPEEDRLQWYKDVREVLEKYDIAWSNWDYQGSFGIINQQKAPNPKLIQALIGSN